MSHFELRSGRPNRRDKRILGEAGAELPLSSSLRLLGNDRDEPGLLRILRGEIAFALEMWLVMHEDLKGMRRVRLLFEFLRAGLGEYCGEAEGRSYFFEKK